MLSVYVLRHGERDGTIVLVHVMEAYAAVKVKLQSFLTSVLDGSAGVEWMV
jgi:hypothetical protein